MGKSLATSVVLSDPVTGEPVTFLAGSTPDQWAADLIKNPKAWATSESSAPSGEAVADDDAPASPKKSTPRKKSTPQRSPDHN